MNCFKIKFISGPVYQLYIVKQRFPKPWADCFVNPCNIVCHDFCCTYPALAAVCIRKSKNFSRFSVVNSLKLFAATDRPVNRIGSDAEFLFQLFHQLIRIACFAVHFVDKSKNRNMPHRAYFEKLPCLRLNTFSGIQHHDC